MKHKLIIRDEAELDIIEAVKYYESQQIGLGKRFLSHLKTHLKRIQTYPEHFHIKRNPYREAVLKKFPYLVIYELSENKVIVFSIFNTYQNPIKKP